MRIGHTLMALAAGAALLSLSSPAFGDEPALEGLALFGISRASGHLARYDFAANQQSTIGFVRTASAGTLLGIDASAYVPGFQNIWAFWNDPADGMAKIVYVDTETAQAVVIGQDLGPGHVTGAVAGQVPVEGSETSEWAVFAVQTVESEEDDDVDFEILGDTVVPSEAFAVKITVLGAAISYGGSYDMPVTVKVRVQGSDHTPFGDFDAPADATVNDDQNPRDHVFSEIFPAGTTIDVIGRAWKKKKSWYSGDSNWHWTTHRTISGADTTSPYLLVLRHGDDVPDIQGFLDQGSIETFVRDYIDQDTGTIVLDENQAIFLFELGVTDLSSPAADFQDLVVLVTLAKSTDDFNETDDDDDADGPAARLLQVNHKTGGYMQVMTLDRPYDGLASVDGQTFYASAGQELYLIDTAAQTETLLGTTPAASVLGLEFAGTSLMGFEIVGDRLLPLDETSGASAGPAQSLGLTDLGTLVFMPVAADPSLSPESYD